MFDLTLLIPAKKEAESLPVFLNELKEYKYKKLIIMSEDDIETKESIKNFNDIEIFFHKKEGYGNALIEGINEIKTEYFCIINADGSMDPKELKDMLFKINVENYDIVFGSRYMKNAGSEDDDIITYVGNYFFTFLGNILFKLDISDILYTYVMGKTKQAQDLKLKKEDFQICVELPILAKKNKLRYTSVPCKERRRIGGKKKVNVFKDGLLILFAILSFLIKK